MIISRLHQISCKIYIECEKGKDFLFWEGSPLEGLTQRSCGNCMFGAFKMQQEKAAFALVWCW